MSMVLIISLIFLEALRVYSLLFMGRLIVIVASDFANAIHWGSNPEDGPWKFHSLLQEIKVSSSNGVGSFSHVFREDNTNYMADSLAKQGLDRTVSLFPSIV